MCLRYSIDLCLIVIALWDLAKKTQGDRLLQILDGSLGSLCLVRVYYLAKQLKGIVAFRSLMDLWDFLFGPILVSSQTAQGDVLLKILDVSLGRFVGSF